LAEQLLEDLLVANAAHLPRFQTTAAVVLAVDGGNSKTDVALSMFEGRCSQLYVRGSSPHMLGLAGSM
jgi:hypothetical protein